MTATTVCENPSCKARRVNPGRDGGAKGLCARCYAYARRHEGVLPGPKTDANLGDLVTVSVSLPVKMAKRLRDTAGPRGVSSYIRDLLERA